jgi:hypothetical protein
MPFSSREYLRQNAGEGDEVPVQWIIEVPYAHSASMKKAALFQVVGRQPMLWNLVRPYQH